MIPKRITNQTILQNSTWKGIAEQVKDLWDKDYYITDFDCGEGLYRVVMSKGTGWNSQRIITEVFFPEDEIKKWMDKGYSITSVSNDGLDWVIIMTGINEVSNQCFIREYSYDDLKEKIKKYWDKGYTVSCIAEDGYLEEYICVFSKSNYHGQGYVYLPRHFNIKEMENFKKSDGYLITEIANFNGKGLFCVASSGTGFSQQKIHREETWDRMAELTQNRWREGYNITTIDYYDGEWYAIFSK